MCRQGWDIKRPTSCDDRPLVSKDGPMQATWARMSIGKPDNVQTFMPFAKGPLKKVSKLRALDFQPRAPNPELCPQMNSDGLALP